MIIIKRIAVAHCLTNFNLKNANRNQSRYLIAVEYSKTKTVFVLQLFPRLIKQNPNWECVGIRIFLKITLYPTFILPSCLLPPLLS